VRIFEELFRCYLRFSLPKVPREQTPISEQISKLLYTSRGRTSIIFSLKVKADHSSFQLKNYATVNPSRILQYMNELLSGSKGSRI
jgi:hypothetical protein